ncbi:MAG: hypothetical protein IJS60_08765 [Abditibacteriota bacterium]|nr:hypothetical protein [Abditibacteriota bacterium]
MATYVTKTDESKTVGTCTYTIGKGYYYTCTPLYTNPDTGETFYVWSKVLLYIAPSPSFSSPIASQFKYEQSSGLFYIQTSGSPTSPSQKIYENEGVFEIKVCNGTEAQETVTPSVSASSYASDWQTKLKCNSGKSYLTVDYPLGAYWQVYINNVLYVEVPTYNPVTGQPTDETRWLRNVSFEAGYYSTSGSGIGEYGIGTFSETPVATITSSDFNFTNTWTGRVEGHRTDGACHGNAWATITCDNDTVTMSANCFIADNGYGPSYHDPSGNECSASFSVTVKPEYMREMYYQYQVDTSNLQGIQTSRLQFQTSETHPVETVINGITTTTYEPYTWTGLSSPTIRYTSRDYFLYVSVGVRQKNSLPMTWEQNTATPPFTTFSDGSGAWRVQETGTIPTQIGGIKCLNPQIINDYEQSNRNDNYGQGDIAGGTDDNIRNTIVKIEPSLSYTPTDLFELTDNKIIIDKNSWQGQYCTITGNTVVVTQQDYKDAKANNTRPMIYQEFERLPYSMENYTMEWQNKPTKEYRQRHWTKCRYVTNPIPHPNHTVYPIKLICKAFGEMKHDQVWILGRDMLITNQGTEYYDQLKINNHQVDYEDTGKHTWAELISSSCDEYMSTVECEKLQIWDDSLDHGDEGYGALYYEEKPMTEVGYLPNIVGRVEVQLPVGTYTLSDMKTKKAINNLSVYAKDEFQQPTNCGFRMPKDYDLASMDYDMNRYIVGCVDGVKGFEIPQTAVTHSAQYQVDWWQIFTYGMIKNNTIIYPKDDIGEITFNSQTHTPNSEGYLPIENITDSDDNPVFWLKPTNSGSLDTRVRVDYLKGDELYRYIGTTQNHVIKLVTEYGGLIHGNSFTLQGEYTDTSPYHHSMRRSLSYNGDYYANQNVGTKTTVDLRNYIEKTVEKPNQCSDYSDYTKYIEWANNEISTRYDGTITNIQSEIIWTEDEPPQKDKIAISVVFIIGEQNIPFSHTFEIPTGLPSSFYDNDNALEAWALAQLVELYERYVYNNEIDGWIVVSDDGNETVIRQYTRGDSSYQRLIDKVIDGGKYWWTMCQRILQGKIWRDSFGYILRQNNDDVEQGENPKILQGGEQQPNGN